MKFHKFISFIFHPIVLPIVSSLIYFIIAPHHIPKEFSYRVLALVFVMTYILPIFLLLFLKKVKLIESFYLISIDERKFPLLFFTILSFLIGNFLLKTNAIDLLAYSFFGCSLALCLVYLLLFSKIKTSLHTLAISGLIGFITVISYKYQLNLLTILILLFSLLGLVATSRLKLKAHTLTEVVLGFFLGFTSQIIVFIFYTFNSVL
ncbi:MAG TPA: hypothetical protein DDZ39_09205 [Flavobacteriaceae bacterium]|jgi:membrane-associated phospholipid phosphatase|nr:hypothetical protein [Flavobacteriaceae bacterium]